MDTAFDPAELVQRFIKYANSQSLEERSRILQIIEDSYTTVVISKRRCLCLGCYENKNYYSAEYVSFRSNMIYLHLTLALGWVSRC